MTTPAPAATSTANVPSKDPLSSISRSPDSSRIVVGGKTVLKIFAKNGDTLTEVHNLRASRSNKVDYSAVDVSWHPIETFRHLIATAAVNTTVLIWDMDKQTNVLKLSGHERAVNRICWQQKEPHHLFSASNDGSIRVWDVRGTEVMCIKGTLTTAIRDVSANPHTGHLIAVARDDGVFQVWDLRKCGSGSGTMQSPMQHLQGHHGTALGIEWHHTNKHQLGTCGRDRFVKVWDCSSSTPTQMFGFQAVMPVSRLSWRPKYQYQLATSALSNDFDIHIWDVNKPFSPVGSLRQHKDLVADFVWSGDVDPKEASILSVSSDGSIERQSVRNAYFPYEHMRSVSLAWNPKGTLTAVGGPINRSRSMLIGSEIPPPPAAAVKADRNRVVTLRSYNFQKNFKTPGSAWGASTAFNENLFRKLALEYKISGESVVEVCLHNASVAQGHGQAQLEHVWTLLLLLIAEDRPALHTTHSHHNQSCASHLLGEDLSHLSPLPSGYDILGPKAKELIVEMLDWCINIGDVQTCATVVSVVGHHFLEEAGLAALRALHWVYEYIALLHRLELFAIAAEVMKTSDLPFLRDLSRTGTTIHTSCGTCNKPPGENQGVTCSNCSNFTGRCEICHLPVRGIYIWCQGCGHGGHVQHLQDWFQNNAECPSGCNHLCLQQNFQ